MRLSKVVMEGYRSIADPVSMHVCSELTCLIGANEHGKSNILEAVPMLRNGRFRSSDKNTETNRADLPCLAFWLQLNPTDRRLLMEAVDSDQQEIDEYEEDEHTSKTSSALRALKEQHASRDSELIVEVTSTGSRRLRFKSGWLEVDPPSDHVPDLCSWFATALPKVVLFQASDDLKDEISRPELEARLNLPFEGLLKLAGIWDDREALFAQDLAAHRLMDEGGRRLTRHIRRIWTQGKTLQLMFHYSGDRLALRLKDRTTYDTPSLRSLGFRSFLSFYLTLYAETQEFDPEGFIFLLDEPGLHLHPQGQKDLLRELRKLGQRNQVIYATHSPFLIDRNDLSSVLLVRKGTSGRERGTRIVHKPYGANWEPLTSALGIVPADAFFPPEAVLVVEGTSDRVYLTTYMRVLADVLKVDLNYLSIISADRREELSAQVSLLLSSRRKVVVLVDGDKGGADFRKMLKRKSSTGRSSLEFIDLRKLLETDKEVSIEDVIPSDSWFAALQLYVEDVLGQKHRIDRASIESIARTCTLAGGAAQYLVSEGLIKREANLSKTSVAHLHSLQDLGVPRAESPIWKLCSEIVRLLRIGR